MSETHGWPMVRCRDAAEVSRRLDEMAERGGWLFRGEPCAFEFGRPGTGRAGREVTFDEEADRLVELTGLQGAPIHVCMMVGQHYAKELKLPTRMLDWSLCPAVAMFFASRPCELTRDRSCGAADHAVGRVWCLDWRDIFRDLHAQWHRLGCDRRRSDNGQIDLDDLMRNGPYDWIVLARMDEPFPRMAAQCGVLSLAGDPARCHLEALRAVGASVDLFSCLEFDVEAKDELSRRAAARGRTESTMFEATPDAPMRVSTSTSTNADAPLPVPMWRLPAEGSR